MKTLVIFLAAFFALDAIAASTSYVCVSASGSMSVRQKCKSGERRLSVPVLQSLIPQGPQGAQGPQGVQGPQGAQGARGPGFTPAGCRVESKQQATSNGFSGVDFFCFWHEFLFSWQFYTEPLALAYLSEAKPYYNDNVPIGVGVVVGIAEFDLADKPEYTQFTLWVSGVCCPR